MTRPLTAYDPGVRVDVDGHVVTVTLDAPATRNACTGDMWVSLGATFRDIAFSGARAVVVTGANGDFCAGADLGGGRRSAGDGEGNGDGAGTAEGPPATMIDSMRVISEVVLAVHECPVPVVAKVDGVCVGAGLGLAMAADMAWCSDRARLSAIFARRGLSLDFGSSWLLRQRVGVHVAKELAFTARIVGGEEAAALGLVNGVVPAGELDATVAGVVEAVAAGPPVALASTKRQLNMASTSTLAQALEVEALGQAVNAQTSDLREAMVAFAERRTPRFEGR